MENAWRGKDATGIAYVDPATNQITVRKAPVNVDDFLGLIDKAGLWPEITSSPIVLLHTRAATKGNPSSNENNHPVVFGSWAVVHNGILGNDDEVFEHFKTPRFAEVDSAAIPLVLAKGGEAGLRLLGGNATIAAWSSESQSTVTLGKIWGTTRPLVVHYFPGEQLIFSSEHDLTTIMVPQQLSPTVTGYRLGTQIPIAVGQTLRISTEGQLAMSPIPAGEALKSKVITLFRTPGFSPKDQATPHEKELLQQIPPMDTRHLLPSEYYTQMLKNVVAEIKTVFGRWVLVEEQDRYTFRPTKGVRKWTRRHQSVEWWNKAPVTEHRPLLRTQTQKGDILHVCPWCGIVGDFKSWGRRKHPTAAYYYWGCPYCELPVDLPSVPIKATVLAGAGS